MGGGGGGGGGVKCIVVKHGPTTCKKVASQ